YRTDGVARRGCRHCRAGRGGDAGALCAGRRNGAGDRSRPDAGRLVLADPLRIGACSVPTHAALSVLRGLRPPNPRRGDTSRRGARVASPLRTTRPARGAREGRGEGAPPRPGRDRAMALRLALWLLVVGRVGLELVGLAGLRLEPVRETNGDWAELWRRDAGW